MEFYILIPFFQPTVNPNSIHPNPELTNPAYIGDEPDKILSNIRQRRFESRDSKRLRRTQYRSLLAEFNPEVYEFNKRN